MLTIFQHRCFFFLLFYGGDKKSPTGKTTGVEKHVQGESALGISPNAAGRTVRESLSSHYPTGEPRPSL